MGFWNDVFTVVSVPFAPVVSVVNAIPAVNNTLSKLPVVGSISSGLNAAFHAPGNVAGAVLDGQKINFAGQLGDYAKGAATVGAIAVGGPIAGQALGISSTAGGVAAGLATSKILETGGINSAAAIDLAGQAAGSAFGVDTSGLIDWGSLLGGTPNPTFSGYAPEPITVPGSDGGGGAAPSGAPRPTASSGGLWTLGVFAALALLIVIFGKGKRK